MRVKPDIVRGAWTGVNLREQTLTRVFQVSGITGQDPDNATAAAVTAVDSIDTSKAIPKLAYSHPKYPALIVVNISTEQADNPDVINVFVVYRWRLFPSQYLKTVGGNLVSQERAAVVRDAAGKITSWAFIGYTNPHSSAFWPAPALQPAIFNHYAYRGTVTFRFLEAFDPEYFNVIYAGSVNKYPWRGYDARTMRLMPLSGASTDGIWYENNYTFDFNPETHDEYIFFRDRISGEVPYDVAKAVDRSGATFQGNGWIRNRDSQEINFNLLFPSIGNLPPQTSGFDLAFLYGS